MCVCCRIVGVRTGVAVTQSAVDASAPSAGPDSTVMRVRHLVTTEQ